MENMLAGLKLCSSLLNYLHKRPSYHHIFGVSKKRNLQRVRMAKCAVVIEAISDHFQSFILGMVMFKF